MSEITVIRIYYTMIAFFALAAAVHNNLFAAIISIIASSMTIGTYLQRVKHILVR